MGHGLWSQAAVGINSEPAHAFPAYAFQEDRVLLDRDSFRTKVPTKAGTLLHGPVPC